MKMSVNYDEVACAVVCCTSRDRNIFIQWIYIASQKMPESERYLRWLAWFRTVARRIGKHIWLLLQCHSHPALNKYAMMRWSTSIRNSRNFIRCLMFRFFSLSLSLSQRHYISSQLTLIFINWGKRIESMLWHSMFHSITLIPIICL